MDKLKFGVLGAGALGVVAAFLPIVGGISLFDIMGAAAGQVILTLVGYVIGLVLGIISLSKGFNRTFAIIATVGFGLSFLKTLDAFGGEIGGKLLFVAAIVGLGCSIALILKPEEAKA